jgi:hypothetical protein
VEAINHFLKVLVFGIRNKHDSYFDEEVEQDEHFVLVEQKVVEEV